MKKLLFCLLIGININTQAIEDPDILLTCELYFTDFESDIKEYLVSGDTISFHNNMSELKWENRKCSPVKKTTEAYTCTIEASQNDEKIRFNINRINLNTGIYFYGKAAKERKMRSYFKGICQIVEKARF